VTPVVVDLVSGAEPAFAPTAWSARVPTFPVLPPPGPLVS
jgi:hypothetical protein